VTNLEHKCNHKVDKVNIVLSVFSTVPSRVGSLDPLVGLKPQHLLKQSQPQSPGTDLVPEPKGLHF
jgi:hypothetical protein